MTDIQEGRSDKYSVCSIDLSKLKTKVAEAIELCGGDVDCLVKLNQVLGEATDLCAEAISQIGSEASRKN